MIQVPVRFGVDGSPVAPALKGHMIIQWGGSLIGVPDVAFGSFALQSVPPAIMYSMPRLRVRGLWLVLRKIAFLLQGWCICAEWLTADFSWVARETGEFVRALAKSRLISMLVLFHYFGCTRDIRWSCGKSTGNFRFRSLGLRFGIFLVTGSCD
jgi:hypothetical protein